jgi:uncharacterized protein (UPF0261 family)
MRTTFKESKTLGKIVADKINKSRGPTVVIIPLKGWSEYDKEGGIKMVNYHGKETGISWYDPKADAVFVKELENNLDNSKQNMEIDLAYGVPGLGRFRVNTFQQRGTLGLVLRVIPFGIATIDQLNLPKILEKIALHCALDLIFLDYCDPL